MVLSPYARAAWVHEFQPDRQVTPSFNVAPGFPFSMSGVSAASDVARINVGANLGVASHASLFAAVSGEFASNTRSYGVTGGYRVGW
jgi:outer membrane autotransporter protein